MSDLVLVLKSVLSYPLQLSIALAALITTSGATIGIPYGFKRVIDQGFSLSGEKLIASSFHSLLVIVAVLAVATEAPLNAKSIRIIIKKAECALLPSVKPEMS